MHAAALAVLVCCTVLDAGQHSVPYPGPLVGAVTGAGVTAMILLVYVKQAGQEV
jgi:hypothetical protein